MKNTKSTASKNTASKAKQTDKSKRSYKKKQAANKSNDELSIREQERHRKIHYEIKLILLIAGTIFALLSVYTEAAGQIGLFIKELFLGMFSYLGYLLPIVIFIYIFVNLNPNFKTIRRRINWALSLLLLGAILMVTMIVYSEVDMTFFKDNTNFGDLGQYAISYENGIKLEGSGILGDMVSIIILKMVGEIGAYILILVCIVSGFIIWTRVSLHDIWDEKRKKLIEKRNELKAKSSDDTLKPEVNSVDETHSKRLKLNEDSPHFLSTLENFKKSNRKKDIKQFDYDTYDNKINENQADENKIFENKPVVDKASEALENELVPSGISEVSNLNNNKKNEKEKLIINEEKDFEIIEPLSVEKQNTKVKEKDIEPEIKRSVESEIKESISRCVEDYRLPSLELLKDNTSAKNLDNHTEHMEKAKLLEETLNNFNVDAKVVSVKMGPSITMFEVQLSPGVKVSKIVGLSDDIALNLATSHVRIAPIPGKAAIGIEVPNTVTSMVTLKEVLNSPEFKKPESKLTIGLGKDISGTPIIGDLASMPHLLIAGATGSGKSVCVNTIISSILFNARPDEVKFLMIDPKVVELSTYNGIPHLILPVVTDPKKASIALNWAVNEMTRRYKLFADQTVRDMKGYNRKAEPLGLEILPQIVVIIDELADLMMVAPNQVEDAICRLAQMARAAGIHLIVATQRPSVDVITGLIKANIPSRIAFSVSSAIDSRTIIDMSGAEKLLGKGDMLFYPVGAAKPKRTQGAFMSDDEVEGLVSFIKNQSLEVQYNESILDEVQSVEQDFSEADEYLEDAIRFVLETGQASASMMQRRFRVGYNRAARLVDSMEERGIIGPSRGSKPREVLMSLDEFEFELNGFDKLENEENYDMEQINILSAYDEFEEEDDTDENILSN